MFHFLRLPYVTSITSIAFPLATMTASRTGHGCTMACSGLTPQLFLPQLSMQRRRFLRTKTYDFTTRASRLQAWQYGLTNRRLQRRCRWPSKHSCESHGVNERKTLFEIEHFPVLIISSKCKLQFACFTALGKKFC